MAWHNCEADCQIFNMGDEGVHNYTDQLNSSSYIEQ